MSIQPKTKCLAHVALRTSDFARAKAFDHEVLEDLRHTGLSGRNHVYWL
ncbi:hypothetical protein [Hymenobacter sp. AT01-02]|nr:hypothetical protein [Hymenobacter sp. AT01-02]